MMLTSLPLRVLAFLTGVISLYVALFLYEDEQGKLQNKLENWWIRLSDQQTRALSIQAAFLRGVAGLLGVALDRLLGDRLISVRAWGVAWCGSMASFSAFLWLMLGISGVAALTGENPGRIGLVVAFGWVLVGAIPAFLRRPWLVRLWFVAVLLLAFVIWLQVGLSLLVVAYFERHRVPYLLVLMDKKLLLAALSASFICDAAFVPLLRWLLRRCGEMSRFSSIGAVLAGGCAVAVVLVLIPARFGGLIGGVVAGFNLFNVLVSLLFVLLALGALTHRVMWPLLNRLIYAVASAGIVRRRNILVTVGLLLLGVAGQRVPEWLGRIISAL